MANGDCSARSFVSALAPPNCTFRLPPPASTPMPMSPSANAVAKLQFASTNALTMAERSVWIEPRFEPMISWPNALLSMPTVSGEICTVPSASVDTAGHWMLKPIGVNTVLMMFSSVCGLKLPVVGMYFERSILTPATVRVPRLKVAVEVVVAPVCCVAVHTRPPSWISPLTSEIVPIVDVAVAVRVAPLSIEVCEVDDRPDTDKKLPGTLMPATAVLEVAVGCVVTLADSVPTPIGKAAGVIVWPSCWFPLTDSACTEGGTSFDARIGGPPLHPAASRTVPIVPRSIVCDSDCASMS